jgi:hypothetical protein
MVFSNKALPIPDEWLGSSLQTGRECKERRKSMKLRAHAFALGAVLSLAVVSKTALAGEIYVVHGITGADLGLSSNLPVDIAVAGACTALQGVEFGQFASAGTLDAGIYQADVHLANGAPCSGAVAVSADIVVPVVGTVFAVAHLDQNGVPTLSQFTANLDDIGAGLAKFQLAHTAAAPAVDVRLKGPGKGAKAKISDLGPGAQSFAAQLPATSYNVDVKPADGGKPLLELQNVAISGDAYTLVFAVGSLSGGTFTVVPVEVTP